MKGFEHLDAMQEKFAGKFVMGNKPRVKLSDPFSPDSYYAVSKVFGEAMG